MIRVVFDDVVRRYIMAHPSHPYVIELFDAIANARFEFSKATLDDVNIAVGKLSILTGGEIECIIEPGEQPYGIVGNA